MPREPRPDRPPAWLAWVAPRRRIVLAYLVGSAPGFVVMIALGIPLFPPLLTGLATAAAVEMRWRMTHPPEDDNCWSFLDRRRRGVRERRKSHPRPPS